MKKLILLASFTLTILMVFGQKSTKEIKADKLFNSYSYSKAIKRFSGVKSLSIEGKRQLAESYVKTNNYIDAENAYANLIQTNVATAEDIFNYASVLRHNGKYADSDSWMTKFKEKAPKDMRAISYTSKASQLAKLQKDEGRYNITHLDINTESQDFGTSYYMDKIVFASTRTKLKGVKRTYNWNNLPFLDIYISDTDTKQLSNVKPLKKQLNAKMHEGPASFTKDGKTMAFTRNNYEEKSSKETVNLEIFFTSKYDDGEWSDPRPFKLNNKEYSVGHPHLSADGKTMFFVSDMPGGIGGTDIYRITKIDDNLWGEPENLTEINTEGNEMFPFYHEAQKVLFFASNGHLGLGGLDVFLSPEVGGFGEVINAGTPLNTRFDDFALVVDEDMKKGYFSSNRETGKGDDDIYSFEFLKPFTFCKKIEGVTKDRKDNILANAEVSLYDNKGNVIESVTTGDDGAFSFCVEDNKIYKLDGKKEKYFDGENIADTDTEKEVVVADLILEKDPGLSLYALVTDKKTGKTLEGVKMTITDNLTGKTVDYTTPLTGDYRRPLADKKINDRGSYNIVLEKEGYFSKTVTYNTEFIKPGVYNVHAKLDLGLDPEVKDLSDLVQINPINFDYNKYYIRDDAQVELNKIVVVMNKYSGMVVELGAHTDCRGSKRYNEKLSDRRAKASAAYIKTKISNPERIYGKGYGEVRLLNGCACEGRKKSDCSESEHDKNRRTEFKVMETGNDKVKVTNTSTDSFDNK